MPATQTKRERAEEEKQTTSEHVETPGLEPVGQRHLEDTVHEPQEAGEAADVAMNSANRREHDLTSAKHKPQITT